METESKLRNVTHSHCQRCGTCCCKGGPALHLKDQTMVEQGRIALRDIYTIRPDEPVFDNVAGTVQTAPTDILKIRSIVGKEPVCCFFDASSLGCAIYDHRPFECRVLQCWNPEPLMKVYQQDRLTREDLLANVEGLMELIQNHQDRCSYSSVRSLALSIRRKEKTATAQQQLIEMIRFDLSLREVTKERSGHDEPMMDFLFGRPLTETIRLFRIRLAKKDCGIVLEAFM